MYDSLPISELVAPNGCNDGQFLDQIVCEHSSQVISRFVARLREEGSQEGCNLVLLSSLMDRAEGLDFNTAWDPSFGGLYKEALIDSGRASEKLACIRLRLHELGCAGTWSTEISEQLGLRFDRWALPPCRRITVHATPSDLCIVTQGRDGQREIRFVLRSKSWRCEDGDLPCLPEVRVADSRMIVLRRRELWSEEVADIAYNLDDSSTDTMASRATLALLRLRQWSPAYFRWVTRVVRFIAPWRVESGQRPSGSSSSNLAPGLVGVGNHDHAASLAESFVHEASHHYYYCVIRLGAVDDGSDTKLYYNPFFGRYRPLDRILLAYHAFVNVQQFCRAAMAVDDSDLEYFEPREQEVTRGLAVMERALYRNPALTSLGQILWKQLYQCAHDQ